MFGWNESGQLAQPTNLARPAECFSAVEKVVMTMMMTMIIIMMMMKLLMACCTGGMAEGAALPRGDTEDTEVRTVSGSSRVMFLSRSTGSGQTPGQTRGLRTDTGEVLNKL